MAGEFYSLISQWGPWLSTNTAGGIRGSTIARRLLFLQLCALLFWKTLKTTIRARQARLSIRLHLFGVVCCSGFVTILKHPNVFVAGDTYAYFPSEAAGKILICFQGVSGRPQYLFFWFDFWRWCTLCLRSSGLGGKSWTVGSELGKYIL